MMVANKGWGRGGVEGEHGIKGSHLSESYID